MAEYARREVWLIVALGLLSTAGVAWATTWWWGAVPALVMLALLGFYRDPPRMVTPGDDLLLSPADGRVIDVHRDDAGPGCEGPTLRILIFLSAFDVHVNRSPCAGRVLSVAHRRGRFTFATTAAAADVNESCALAIAPAPPLIGPVVVRQIAGGVARRIVCAARPGAELASGQRFGMIKLGSQTEVRVPDDGRWRDVIRVGAKVRAGVTILARCVRTAPPSDAASARA